MRCMGHRAGNAEGRDPALAKHGALGASPMTGARWPSCLWGPLGSKYSDLPLIGSTLLLSPWS